MEITSKFKERENYSPLNSPSSHANNGACQASTSTTNGNGVGIPITRSDPNSPYPTTFVTADTTSFKQVVQMLTGSSEPGKPTTPTQTQHQHQNQHQHHQQQQAQKGSYVIPPIRTAPKKQGFKLYERRNSALKNMMINPLSPNTNNNSLLYAHHHQHHHHHNHHTSSSFSPRNKPPEILSPSILDFPSLTLSPVTPLVELDPFDKSSTSSGGRGSSASSSSEAAEERAIAEKGFYLHPSPISTPRDSEPQLLTLFPLSSPRASE